MNSQHQFQVQPDKLGPSQVRSDLVGEMPLSLLTGRSLAAAGQARFMALRHANGSGPSTDPRWHVPTGGINAQAEFKPHTHTENKLSQMWGPIVTRAVSYWAALRVRCWAEPPSLAVGWFTAVTVLTCPLLHAGHQDVIDRSGELRHRSPGEVTQSRRHDGAKKESVLMIRDSFVYYT